MKLAHLAMLLAAFAAACSSSPTETTPTDPGANVPVEPDPPTNPTPTPPAPAPAPAYKPAAFPSVVNVGGAIITKPHVVPVVAKDDANADELVAFTKKLGSSAFWKAAAGEYGIDAFTVGEPVVVDLQGKTELTDEGLRDWLVAGLEGAEPGLGEPDSSTLYAMFFPSGTNVTLGTSKSCQKFYGYHGEAVASGVPVGYAIMADCEGIDQVTRTTSHEIIEWATDPFPYTKPAFAKIDDKHWAWQVLMNGEVADMCAFMDIDYLHPAELGHDVQRFWSNKLSSAGSFPCAPAKPVKYVQAVVEPEDDALVPQLTYGAKKVVKTKAIRVAPGASREIDVSLYAEGDVAKVPIYAVGLAELHGQSATDAAFAFKTVAATLAPGGTTKLTITAKDKVAADVLVLVAGDPRKGATYWPVLVTSDPAENPASGVPSVSEARVEEIFEMAENAPAVGPWKRTTPTHRGMFRR